MKTYAKPTLEILVFRTDENIAADSIFEYTDGASVPVTLFGIQMGSWDFGIS